MDEIKAACTRLQSSSAAEREEAYNWLLHSRPFMAVVEKLRGSRLSLDEVAAMLAEGVEGSMAEYAWQQLSEAMRQVDPD